MSFFRRILSDILLNRPARKLNLPEWSDKLTQSGRTLSAQMKAAPDTPANHEKAAHMIGIERWGQRRLRQALGELPLEEEYDRYRPSTVGVWADLHAAFDETRADTVALVNALNNAGIDVEQTIKHNSYGPLTIRGWLRYLDLHANIEGRVFR